MSEFKCSATFKRAEQLKRWEESETNEHSPDPKGSSRIRFSVDCVFLAACAAGEKDEVLRLVQSGADVNTPSADGLTALHQACIDNKLDMVEYLIKLGADVNHSDNEGWTPLHATASCGFVSIARFLLSHGANLSAVNNEGELPVDISEAGPMKTFLLEEIQNQGIDCEKARSEEERVLTELSKRWNITKSPDAEIPDEKTGATPLHVAAAKGYIKVMNILLSSCNVDVDPVDFDGWTPLHASAHWGQDEAATILVQYGADMHIKNYVGQTCFDVAVTGMIDHLEDLKNRHDSIAMAIYDKKRRPTGPDELQIKHKKLDLQIDSKTENNINNKKTVEKKNALNTNSHSTSPSEGKPPKVGGVAPPSAGPLSPSETPPTDDEPSWRHSARQKSSHQPTAINEKESPVSTPSDNEIILRRTQSCEIEKLSPQQEKLKKDSLLSSNPSPARSSMESVNEQNDTPTKNALAEAPPSKIFPGNIFKNFFKSFAPPVRDEESETQRKAHAKRVRETRRSTQGVTLDEIKSAEQLVKKKNNGLQIVKSETEPMPKRDTTTTNTESESTQKEIISSEETRDKGPDIVADSVETETTVTIALPRASQSGLKKEEEKDGDTRGATQAAQNVIQRRRRPKRRSTGVVNVDLDEITPDQPATNDGTESGSESTEQSVSERSTQNNDESCKIDYKALWEASQLEIKQLKEIVLANERELTEARQSIEKYTNVITSVSENEKREKRERRATERKMSEMEEELKFQHAIQNENKRLKDENGALIRVISKLSK